MSGSRLFLSGVGTQIRMASARETASKVAAAENRPDVTRSARSLPATSAM